MDTELFNMGWMIGEITAKGKNRVRLLREMARDGWSKLGTKIWVRACVRRKNFAAQKAEWEPKGMTLTFVSRASWERSYLRHGAVCRLPENDPTGKVIVITLDGKQMVRTQGTVADLPRIMDEVGAGRVMIEA